VRRQFLGQGALLAESEMPELHTEEDLLRANAEYSIAHIRSALSALDGEVSRAQQLIYELFNEQEEPHDPVARVATWQPAQAFRNKTFVSEEEVDAAFDAERERLKAWIREGKTVRVL
jgi:hypothetical protein